MTQRPTTATKPTLTFPESAFIPEFIGTAKSAPSLISGDEQHFSAIASTLKQRLSELSTALDRARKGPRAHGQEALERDMEVHRLATRLRTLSRFGLDLCLGRMEAADGTEPIYVGRLGLTDDDGRRLLIDWRSPAAAPFFAATHAHPMGLLARRRYRWSAGLISDYWDEVFTADRLESNAALDDQSAFIASLGVNRSRKMRDVVSTIQADQDAIIRAPSRGALVVDGGPGTGKTVVALHRAAYLLYSDPRVGHHLGGVLFIGPHQPYLAYISDVLPGLGEEGVRVCTLSDLDPAGETAVPEADRGLAALKSSVEMVSAISTAVGFFQEPPAQSTIINTEWAELELDARDWAEAFSAPEDGTPHNEARDAVHEALLDILVDKLDAETPIDMARAALATHPELSTALSAAWPLLEPANIVAGMFTIPTFLAMCAPWLSEAQIRSLQRSDGLAWTDADLPLLDAARQRLGDSGASARRARRRTELAARRQEMAAVIEEAILADDSELLVSSMLRGEDMAEKLDQAADLPEESADPLAGPFTHIVVDEAQELSDAQWQMLLRRCPSGSFTIVGDRAQAREGFDESWEERLTRIGLTRISVSTLSINYRTPAEIMVQARAAITAELPDANVPQSIRTGGAPVERGSVADLSVRLEAWLVQHPTGHAAVIGHPNFAPRPRVASLTPVLAKGLEFDLVIVVNPQDFGTGITGAVDRYVAMTRATGTLLILEDH
ncbi:RNA polymerase recycling motor ATPase HelR [Paeniglutamicibacter terrestris]|uniref:AAA family ATPase n=1 Tax=Paeniglutamicibacter terrestris TaxID=2723403 RepID=A0ABX1G1S8_9MICC|nr:RNA polymerase recycling motor ATPase HelR [Paeniglutamicibacter terrestris]NKG20208.1 AAA family ATPase [Paeniglutamicibacter terrestris]